MRAGEAANAVYAEQVGTAFRQTPIALAVNLVNAALVAGVLWRLAVPASFVLPFFAAVALATCARLLLWLRYRRTAVPSADARRWARRAAAGAALTGLCWGVGGAVLFPIAPVGGKVFLTIVIGGMCAGAVVVDAAHFATLLGFLLSASLPMAIGFFAGGWAPGGGLGATVVVFAAALALAGSQLSRVLASTMRLRWELGDAQQRLEAETAELRVTEAALRQAQKLEAVGQLTGGIAHDFNNLLTVVIGNLQLASTRAGDDAAIARPLRSALHAAEQGSAVIQRLLAFARRQHLEPRPLDVAALVRGMEELLARTLGANVRLLIDVDGTLAPAQVDANQIELAILNLVLNARDAMPDGGTVRIALENRSADAEAPPELAPGHYVLITIIDDGNGMDEETLAQAFEPFFTTKDAGRGSGLGLPMVQGFAAQSHGAVRIRSRAGAGTMVELWLPQAAAAPGRETAAAAPPAISPGAASVVLCDDDDEVRGVLREFLTAIGYAVREANGGEAALRLLNDSAAADLLIVDQVMPGISGLETVRRARARWPQLRLLLITGHAGSLDGDAGGVPVLRKPFGPDELARRVAEVLAA